MHADAFHRLPKEKEKGRGVIQVGETLERFLENHLIAAVSTCYVILFFIQNNCIN